MRCEERERLESALNNALNRQEELANRKLAGIRSGDPDFSRFETNIARATERVNRAQQLLKRIDAGTGAKLKARYMSGAGQRGKEDNGPCG